MEEAPLGGLSAKVFLRRHWQKRPLLVRNALPGLRRALDKSALFGLATRGDIESRLVEHARGNWRVTEGPLQRARLTRLARSRTRNWTLLVNGVNHHVAGAERLLRRFAFLPQARLDDVMVSYAAPGGGVGPHFDSYDVFLIQGAGRRTWRLARARAFTLEAQAPLRLIRDFVADEEYLLEPGDLLYLPPGWGHDGVAVEECFTWSVGFRAPRGAELAAGFLDYLHERGLPDATYRDPGLRPARHPARIGAGMIEFAARVLGRIRWNRGDALEHLGRFLTLPKANVVFRARRSAARLGRSMAVLDPRTQMLYAGRRFFINGEALAPDARQRRALSLLADRRRVPGRLLAGARLAALISGWQRAGYLHLQRRS
jgi:50S ribosomal protein L16 3-hydroxylase